MFQLGGISTQRRAQMLVEGGDYIYQSPLGFKYHVIRQSTTVNVYVGGEVELLLIGGGGGGGHRYGGGGGGAGGVIHVPSYQITPGSYSAVVGEGGAGSPAQGANPPYGSGSLQPANDGNDTTIFGFTAYGGGRGGAGGFTAGTGGSGGGSSDVNFTSNTAEQTNGSHTMNSTNVIGWGNDGGPRVNEGGGGGGAGAPGVHRLGGDGIQFQSYITYRIAGGGNAASTGGGIGTDIYGAGNGGTNGGQRNEGQVRGTDGVANTGSGGGGGSTGGFAYWYRDEKAGDGGSGLIIIKYRFLVY